MIDEVQLAINNKLGVIAQYYDITPEAQPLYDALVQNVLAVAGQSQSYMDFESRFAAAGLDRQMGEVMCKCAYRQSKPTVGETARMTVASYKTAFKDEETRKDFGRSVAESAALSAKLDAESAMYAKAREARTAAGVEADYTIASNRARRIGSLLDSLLNRD